MLARKRILIQTIVEGAHRSQHGLAATVLGLFTLFFGATRPSTNSATT